MINHLTKPYWLVVALILQAACASAGGMRTEPVDAGEAKVYAAPLTVVVPAAQQAVLSAGLDVDQMSQPDSLTWMIIAEKGTSLFSWGELVRVVAQQTPDGSAVVVRVLTKRRMATNITAKGDWSGPIFERLDQTLAHQ
jgi:hypothetical protein